ncbi:hypothetical protein T484DRAFT_1928555 [Baffinella frigidus]|nr:hypothetical protein T484DRAFT_1928555 [Cryptophyta sp. CCMP2293]
MGGAASTASNGGLPEKHVQKLVKATGYSAAEVEFLHKRFKALCKRGQHLSQADITEDPNLQGNAYVRRLFNVMPKDELGCVRFETFVATAAKFRPEAPIDGKLSFIFNLFDYDMSDTLEPEELSDMVRLVKPELSESERAILVEQTVRDVLLKGGDMYKDGLIHEKSFVVYAKTLPDIDALVTLSLADHLH